MIQNLS